MVEISDERKKSLIADLEKMGPSQVRALLQSGDYAPVFKPVALEWLKSKDDDAERMQAASQAEMAAAASRANEAADRAASAAERAAAAAESQAVAASEQASSAREQTRIAHQALITARIAAAIGAVALIATIAAYLHPIH